MNKAYSRTNWVNDETPLNESNLNKMDAALDEIDNRVIRMDKTVSRQEEINKQMVEAAETATEAKELALSAAEEAKEAAQTASEVTNIHYANKERAGIAKPQDIYVDPTDGSMSMITRTTSPTLTNSYSGGLKIDRIAGASEQKQYSGKNLIPYPHDYAYPYTNHGVTFTYDEETGYITANGTANSTVANYSVLNIQSRTDTKTPFYLPKGRYKITGCPSGGSGTTYRIAIGYTNTENTYSSYVVEYGKGAEFEVTDETRPLQVQITIQNGYTANNLVFKPMIRLAAIADDTYEPYVGGIPSPNPKYPQEIKSVEVEEIKTEGKNLIPYPYYESDHTQGGIDWTDLGDGRVKANGTASVTVDYIFQFRQQGIILQPGKYKVSGCPSGGSISTYYIAVNTFEGPDSIGTDFGDGITFTLEKETMVGIFIHVRAGATVNNLIFKPMLRKADIEDNTWEPYKSSTASITFTCRAIEVSADDDYTYEKGGKYYIADTIERVDGGYKYVQRIGVRVFDGVNIVCRYVSTITGASEELTQINLGSATEWVDAKLPSRSNQILSDKFTAFDYSLNSLVKAYTARQATTTGIVVVYVPTDLDITTIAEANTWLQNNNVTVQYLLAEPVVTTLSDEEAIELLSVKSFDTVTYLSTDSKIEPIIDVEYGTSKVGGYTLEALNTAQKNEIQYASLATLTNSLATALVAGSEE